MTDHYTRAVESLEDVLDVRTQLEVEQSYTAPDRQAVAVLNGRLGTSLKLAEVHALLALRQTVQDAAADGRRLGVTL